MSCMVLFVLGAIEISLQRTAHPVLPAEATRILVSLAAVCLLTKSAHDIVWNPAVTLFELSVDAPPKKKGWGLPTLVLIAGRI